MTMQEAQELLKVKELKGLRKEELAKMFKKEDLTIRKKQRLL